MEQHDAYQHKNVKGEETQEETDIALNVKEHHPEDSASSSASTSRETKTNNGEDKEQTDVKNSELAEKKKASSPDEASMQNVEGNSTPPQADDGSHGDNRETQRNEQLTKTGQEISREYHTGESKALETTTPPNPGDRKGDQVDGPKARHGAETPGTNNINTVASDDSELAEKKKASSPDEASMQNVEGNSTPPQADDGSHGDNRETQRNEQLTKTGQEISREYHTGESKALETTTPPNPGDRKDDQVDGPKARHGAETPGTNNINTVASDDDGRGLVKVSDSEEEKDIQEKPTSPQIAVPQQISVEEERDQQTDNVETIGPTTEETTEPIVPVGTGIFGERKIYLMGIGIVLVLAILVQYLLQPESPPQKNDTQQIEIFLRQMEKVKTQFPNQRAELWIRSKIHLLRHLRAAQPTEPVSLILTAGLKAEKTLHCLAQSLASAFSSALNASVLHIDGASKASQDSDEVKLDIDNQLQGAFEGDKPVAVIHRFEELPPGSTLIFYRYCDHENAAYKKTCLMFTVLLGEEEEIPANSHLSIVEEMVDDHLQKKFLSGDHPISFDRMDLNKYGGLWSRISHLILPVAAEERIEHEGC
ncbi:torsin-1A-interacting protein 2-like isoform X5 [Siniperca chuatsi]|uniref:torsin-1A-interacting protein 2-like isoform X5 n=1 Tax=Siniperca chuatsi TaxID=119488 RepID=UPI001CE1B324|nr:torsin-1A-interacting protein 2-like isoform X5 [Siniperca chuatsi]